MLASGFVFWSHARIPVHNGKFCARGRSDGRILRGRTFPPVHSGAVMYTKKGLGWVGSKLPTPHTDAVVRAGLVPKGLRPSASSLVVLSYMNVSHYNSQRCLQEMAIVKGTNARQSHRRAVASRRRSLRRHNVVGPVQTAWSCHIQSRSSSAWHDSDAHICRTLSKSPSR